jgi:GT2 family glycosyltransferase
VKLLAVLLNWRTADMTLKALDRLVVEIRKIPGARIVVVDNDSRDGSFERLREGALKYDDVVDVAQSGHNGGFGYGNNVGLRTGMLAADPPDYFYLLNSDAFPDDGALPTLLAHMDQNPATGIAGSYIHDLAGIAQASCFRFPNVWNEIDRSMRLGVVTAAIKDRIAVMCPLPDETTKVDWVAGASMILRRKMLDEIGVFDETFFLYFEETDLCLRARRAGWDIVYVRDSSVAHIGGASTGVSSHTVVKARMPKYWFDSRRHYWVKNHGRGGYWLANAAHFLGGASFRVRRFLQHKPDPERPREWLDGVVYNFTHP